MKKAIQLLCCLTHVCAFAQFEPQVGQIGTTAINGDSSVFVAWATSCSVVRGYQNIADPSAGYATDGDTSSALGSTSVSNGVVSLGDGGSATLTFAQPIANGTGYDFAVFENGFYEAGTTLAFLEFAFVEVSSDGVHFFRFPAQYVGEDSIQVASFQATDTRFYHNLGGKYIYGYGTPFDLEEMKGNIGLDVNNVTHVRIVDVVGSIETPYATHDSKGNIVNDPWPTEFPSSGFDLDAVGVINLAGPAGIVKNTLAVGMKIFPNPAIDFVQVVSENGLLFDVDLSDLSGKVLKSWSQVGTQMLDVSSVNNGAYLFQMRNGSATITQKLIIQ